MPLDLENLNSPILRDRLKEWVISDRMKNILLAEAITFMGYNMPDPAEGITETVMLYRCKVEFQGTKHRRLLPCRIQYYPDTDDVTVFVLSPSDGAPVASYGGPLDHPGTPE